MFDSTVDVEKPAERPNVSREKPEGRLDLWTRDRTEARAEEEVLVCLRRSLVKATFCSSILLLPSAQRLVSVGDGGQWS